MCRPLRLYAWMCMLLVCLYALTACQSPADDPEEPVVTGFACDLEATYGDMAVSGHISRGAAGTLTLELSEPATLDGLTMMWDGDQVTLGMHGLTFGIDPTAIEQTALGKGLLSALDAALGSHGGARTEDNTLSTKGESVSGEFELLSDPETGNLLSLRVPALALTATFSNFVLQ